FQKFLDGGSREYPSDGNIPVDIAANEAMKILNKIKEIAYDIKHPFHLLVTELLEDPEKDIFHLVRGTLHLYLCNHTTRDWRRKRSTDDIDFWIPSPRLLNYVIKSLNDGWVYNPKRGEWEKRVHWNDLWTGERKSGILIASNDINQRMDFGLGSYLEGPGLKNIIKKKLVRGHDVDLSDIINCAILNNIPIEYDEDSPWTAIVECANMRHSRTTSNIISLCRLSYGVANYIRRVGLAIKKYKDTFKNKELFPDKKVVNICRVSSHWLSETRYKPNITRDRIYNNLVKQERKKLQYANNLYFFADQVLKLLNSKYEHIKIKFAIIK
ncbi:MAG: hypothetical protein ACTSPQ_12085, partial [Candidatus Helarchaeota archaeon]